MSMLSLTVDPVTERFVMGNYDRVILVANNPAIGSGAVVNLELTANDVVVQFNLANSFGLLAQAACHKCHILNANAEGSYWGFGTEGRPVPDVHAQAHNELIVLFTRWMSQTAKAYVAGLEGKLWGGTVAAQWMPPLFPYPKSKAPTAGFFAVSQFRAVNLLRIFAKRPALPLVLLGFTNVYPADKIWQGHEYEFEQRVYDTLPDVTRIAV